MAQLSSLFGFRVFSKIQKIGSQLSSFKLRSVAAFQMPHLPSTAQNHPQGLQHNAVWTILRSVTPLELQQSNKSNTAVWTMLRSVTPMELQQSNNSNTAVWTIFRSVTFQMPRLLPMTLLLSKPIVMLNKADADAEFDSSINSNKELPSYQPNKEMEHGKLILPNIDLMFGDFVKVHIKVEPPVPVLYCGEFWTACRTYKLQREDLAYLCQLHNGDKYVNLEFFSPNLDEDVIPAVFETDGYFKGLHRYWCEADF